MRVLIDTHVYLWWLDDPHRLSKKALATIEDGDNTIFVSVAVPWEIMIKKKLGKLQVTEDVMSYMEQENFLSLAISHQHVMALDVLPGYHQDPFDRIQIAQALIENITLITRDQHILRYDDIKTLKA